MDVRRTVALSLICLALMFVSPTWQIALLIFLLWVVGMAAITVWLSKG
jgi:hypothetical protein